MPNCSRPGPTPPGSAAACRSRRTACMCWPRSASADEMIRRGSVAESFDFHSQSGARLGSVNQNMRQRFGQPAVNMCRATLNEALINKAWCENVELRFEKRLVAIEDRADKPVVAHFADGSFAEGDFVIGADGVHSAVRAHVIPDGPKPFDTGLIGFGGFVAAIVDRGCADRPARGDDVRTERLLRLRLLQLRCRRRRDVVEHAAFAWHRCRGLPRHEPGRDQAASARFPRRLARSDPADSGSGRKYRGDRDARRRDPADLVAQAHAVDRRCRARHQSACRPGRLAGARRRHAARPADAGPAGAWR